MIVDIFSSIVTELFIRGRQLNISLVLSRNHILVPKDVNQEYIS